MIRGSVTFVGLGAAGITGQGLLPVFEGDKRGFGGHAAFEKLSRELCPYMNLHYHTHFR